jgi:O-methyltransferase
VIKRTFHKALGAVPGAESAWIALNRIVGRWPGPAFSGWGMTTHTLPPWLNGGGDSLTRDFIQMHQELLGRVRNGQFHLSQFADAPDKIRVLDGLMWRHYLVFWSARSAAQTTAAETKTLVECGVCDGLTAYFAMRALQGRFPYKAALYDAWESIDTPSGNYASLALESTRGNLRDFERETTFVKGFLPESFAAAPLPSDVVWLHIDLNAAAPTVAVLENLYDRMPPGAVILFDDYGWRDYQDTKRAIESFVGGKQGMLLPVPTGQALFFKGNNTR